MSRRHGYSLVETLIVIVVVGIILGLGLPKMRIAMQKNEVRSARTALVTMYNQARTAAIRNNQTTTLQFAGNTVSIVGPSAQVLAAVDLNAQYGVTVIADANFAIDPRGFGDAGATMRKTVVTKAGFRDSIMVTGFGRVVSR